MKEIKIKSFRCEEYKPGQWKVFFNHRDEERFIGYFSGYPTEANLLGNSIGDYSNVLNRWDMAGYTYRKVYRINMYEAYVASEKGIYFSFDIPKDTIYYKHEILGEESFNFPGWKDGELVTEDEHTFSFVSCEGIRTYKFNK